ncbi:MAG: RNA polymerase sigma factor [Sedimentisphaerales bacterium]|nr:RNA polymerase sigma factor [Sedimentisphaerales bacterium]
MSKKPILPLNEAALVCQAREGDREAVRILLERHWNWLKGLTYSVLGNKHDMEDALQDLCVLVLDKIATLREPERFRGWLATVARNNALAHRRARQLQPRSQSDEMDILQPTSNGTLLDKIAIKEDAQRLLTALDGLPEKYREVFILKHIQDLSYADIAELLDIAVTAVQIRLVRARRMIANSLAGRPNNKVPRT